MTKVGLIVPPLHGQVPPDAAALYPRTEFLIEGLGLQSLSGDNFSAANARLSQAAARLAARGAQSILLFGTSLSFYAGQAGNAALEARLAQATALPSATLTTAFSKAMRLAGLRDMAVVTAYNDRVNDQFMRYFQDDGFRILTIAGMDLTALSAVERVPSAAIAALADTVLARGAGPDGAAACDGLVISCAGLATLDAVRDLKARHRLPVLSSAMIGAWAAQILAGADSRCAGLGDIFEMDDISWS